MALTCDQHKLILLENSYLMYNWYKKYKKVKRSPISEIYCDKFIFGEFYHLYPQLRVDKIFFRAYTRMDLDTFDYIVNYIRPICQKEYTNFQEPISVEERLLITLRYLATGTAFRQIAFNFRVSKTAVSTIVIEVCKAISITLRKVHMRKPKVTDFKKISREFYEKWDFPNCVGSIDGKHIRVKCPSNSGSMYFNYKQYFSIVLMAISDAKYKCIMVDIGAYGKDSDGGVLQNSQIYRNIENGSLKLPNMKLLPNSSSLAPFVFIGDEAFPLKDHLLRPFPRKQLFDEDKAYYNYRLSRARMTIECAFGIAASKFRILQKSIETKVENADHIIKAICVLHNIIIDLEKNHTDFGIIQNELDHAEIESIQGGRFNNRAPQTAITIRNSFVQYFKYHKI